MNVKLEAALAYGRMRWRIFPCHSIGDGRCSCGKACSSPGKHPRTRGGFKDATDDEAQIRRWWTKWPDANIGLATGSGIVAIDIDGPEGANEFKALVQANEPVPETLTSRTGRGFHLVYSVPEGAPSVRSSARGAVHVRGEGGYIILPPSNHHSGRNYEWIKKASVASLPTWLRQWTQGYEITANKPAGALGLGPAPSYLSRSNQVDIGAKLTESLKTVWSASEQARIISALAAIPPINYETWVTVGMALHQLGWEGNGTDLGFALWDQWSQLCPDKYALAACEEKWRSFGRTARGEVTLGTVYHLAQQHGWNPTPAPLGASPSASGLNGHTNGANGSAALPAAFLTAQAGAIVWPDVTEDGKPRSTCTNASVAVKALRIDCRKDLFHEKFLVAGEAINAWAGDMSDDVIQMIRKTIRYRYGFDPKVENTRDACTQLCLERQFDPVCDYLDGLVWDGTPRLDRWLTTYMGAPDTELNHAIGRLSMVAAVRRVRQPGAKFDQIVVLEGPEGRGKSAAIEILAGRANFSDGKILGLSDREQQEATAGVWLYEIAELTGMRKAEIEHVKAFASRTVDRARPAYGRFRVDRPRRTIFFATTNRDDYLQSDTGNRRFWPVATSSIDLDGLRAARDQLWAEAAAAEKRGESIGLPERLWVAAGHLQNERLEHDEWEPMVRRYLEKVADQPDVSIFQVLVENQFLQLRASDIGRTEQMRAGAILRRLGWFRFRKRTADGSGLEWRYRPSGG